MLNRVARVIAISTQWGGLQMSISMAGVSGEVSLCFLLTTFYIFLISPCSPFSLPPFSPPLPFSPSLLYLPPLLSLSPPVLFFFPISLYPPSFLSPPLSLSPLFSFSSLISFSLFSLPPFSISLQGVKISFIYRRPTLYPLEIAVDFLKSL
jgi:hypothetical protein